MGQGVGRERWGPRATASPENVLHVPALHRLHLFRCLLWVLGLLVVCLCLLLGLGAYYNWRWV